MKLKQIVKRSFKKIILNFFFSKVTSETIFRRNSLASKLITIYFKIRGQKYLQLILKDLLHDLLEEDLKLEV